MNAFVSNGRQGNVPCSFSEFRQPELLRKALTGRWVLELRGAKREPEKARARREAWCADGMVFDGCRVPYNGPRRYARGKAIPQFVKEGACFPSLWYGLQSS